MLVEKHEERHPDIRGKAAPVVNESEHHAMKAYEGI
jgi:hypothetical protein